MIAVNTSWPYNIHLAESDCDEKEEWLWEWDNAGVWCWIIPKTRPHQAIDISGSSGIAGLYGKGSGNNQKFRVYGKWIISKAWPGYALAVDDEGNLRVELIQCDSDKHDFSPIQIHCDSDKEEVQEKPGTDTELPGTEPETPATTEELLQGKIQNHSV